MVDAIEWFCKMPEHFTICILQWLKILHGKIFNSQLHKSSCQCECYPFFNPSSKALARSVTWREGESPPYLQSRRGTLYLSSRNEGRKIPLSLLFTCHIILIRLKKTKLLKKQAKRDTTYYIAKQYWKWHKLNTI